LEILKKKLKSNFIFISTINFIIGAILGWKYSLSLFNLIIITLVLFLIVWILKIILEKIQLKTNQKGKSRQLSNNSNNNSFVKRPVRKLLDLENLCLIFALALFLILGLLRFNAVSKETELGIFYEQKITVLGEIYGEVSIGSFSNRYKVKITEIKNDKKYIYPEENIIISTYKYPEFHSGQIVRVSGQLEKPKNFENENGIEFDYVNFLKKDNIYGILKFSQVEVIGEKLKIDYLLFKIKNFFLFKISQILTSPEAEYMGGLLLGVKQSLGDQLEKEFRIAGLIHVVVLSGYNITIIIVAVFKFLSFLPNFYKYLLGLVFVAMFAIMVGSGATVIRASLMAFLMIFSKFSKRSYDVNKALFFAGLVMISINPLIIFFDPSFQLSFVASLGLINLSPLVKKIFVFIPEKMEAREIIASAVSTQIAVLPMILGMSGELSIVSLPANLIVLPLIPATMLLGFLVGIFSIIFKPIALAIGLITNYLLRFQLVVVGFFANLPFAVVNIKQPDPWVIFLFYSFLIILLYFRPIQIFKKIIYVLTFPARLIVGHK